MSVYDDETEDDNDAAWAHQQQLEQELLEEDPGYVEYLFQVAGKWRNEFSPRKL
jgi:hypothetical protein